MIEDHQHQPKATTAIDAKKLGNNIPRMGHIKTAPTLQKEGSHGSSRIADLTKSPLNLAGTTVNISSLTKSSTIETASVHVLKKGSSDASYPIQPLQEPLRNGCREAELPTLLGNQSYLEMMQLNNQDNQAFMPSLYEPQCSPDSYKSYDFKIQGRSKTSVIPSQYWKEAPPLLSSQQAITHNNHLLPGSPQHHPYYTSEWGDLQFSPHIQATARAPPGQQQPCYPSMSPRALYVNNTSRAAQVQGPWSFNQQLPRQALTMENHNHHTTNLMPQNAHQLITTKDRRLFSNPPMEHYTPGTMYCPYMAEYPGGTMYPSGTVYAYGTADPHGTVYPHRTVYPNGTMYPSGTEYSQIPPSAIVPTNYTQRGQNKLTTSEPSEPYYDTSTLQLWQQNSFHPPPTSPIVVPSQSYQPTYYIQPPPVVAYKNHVDAVTPPLKDIESRIESDVPMRQKNNQNNNNNWDEDASRYSTFPMPTRRSPSDWDKAVPSQEKRNENKWWMFCS